MTKTEKVVVKVEKETKIWLVQRAEKEERDVSSLIRYMIRCYKERKEPPNGDMQKPLRVFAR